MTQRQSLLTPTKKGESSWLVIGVKAFTEMVRVSDRYKYISKTPCEWSTHPPAPGQCSTSRQEKWRTDGADWRRREVWESSSHTLHFLGEAEAWLQTVNVWGCAHSTGDVCERILSYAGINLELGFPWMSQKNQSYWQTDGSKGSLSSGLRGIRTRKMEDTSLEWLALSITILKWPLYRN